MRKSVAQSVTGVIDALHEAGMVDDPTVREIHALCLPEVKNYSPDGIVALRKKMRLSRAAFAQVMNVSPSTVRKWERGVKKPTGAGKRLFDILERKGLQGIL